MFQENFQENLIGSFRKSLIPRRMIPYNGGPLPKKRLGFGVRMASGSKGRKQLGDVCKCLNRAGKEHTLPESNMFALKNEWLEDEIPFGTVYFKGRTVSFRMFQGV